MNKLISVVIPVYKVEKYLNRCVESVVNQTYKNLEIILVDDGSTDNCPKMCDEWAKKDKRIKVIHKENGGLSDARNAGIDIVKGEYISFVDSDDWIPNDSIMNLYLGIKEKNADISVGLLKDVFDDTKVIKKENDNIINQVFCERDALEQLMYLHDFSNNAWGKIYKTNLFKDIRYPVGKYYEDLATTYKLFSKSKKIVLVNCIVYYYFQNLESIMHKKYSSKRLEGLDFALEELEFIEKNYKEIINSAIYRLFFECLSILNDMPYKCENKPIVKKYIKKYRNIVLKDKKISTKQRLLCISSFLGQFGVKIAFKVKLIIKGRKK